MPCFAAARRSLVFPPAAPTGKRTWTGGFMCLSIAFSGLPTLIPTVAVVCFRHPYPGEVMDQLQVLIGVPGGDISDVRALPSTSIRVLKMVAHSSEMVADSLLRV